MLICRAIGGRGNRFGLDGMWMYVECVCGYEQVRYRNIEGDWYRVDYTLLHGSGSGKGVYGIGFSNSKSIGDAGDEKVFVDLNVERGKDVAIMKAVR